MSHTGVVIRQCKVTWKNKSILVNQSELVEGANVVTVGQPNGYKYY